MIQTDRKKFMIFVKVFGLSNVDRAARIILRGVARNRSMIVFPLHAKAAWYLNRLFPKIIEIYFRLHMKSFRSMSRK